MRGETPDGYTYRYDQGKPQYGGQLTDGHCEVWQQPGKRAEAQEPEAWQRLERRREDGDGAKGDSDGIEQQHDLALCRAAGE